MLVSLSMFLQHSAIWIIALLHPFYVSVTEINHNAKEKRIEVSCRIFFDDLEDVLRRNYNVQLDIIKPADKKLVDKLLADYLKKHVQIKADGKPVNLLYLGYKIEEDACWCFLEADNIASVKQLEVQNDVLFAEFGTQTNLLQVTANGQEKNTKLDNPESKAVFRY